MARSTNKLDRMSTPIGEAVYPALHRADTKFDDAGTWKADVRVKADDAKGIMEKLGKKYKEHTGSAMPKDGGNLWSVELDDDGDPTGNIMFKLRVKNVVRKDGEMWVRKPKLFDTSSPPQPISVEPFGGTKMIVAFDVYCYDIPKKGVKLQPVAVQIIELKTGGDDDPDAFGFNDMEAGFKTDDTQENPFAEEQGEEEDSADF